LEFKPDDDTAWNNRGNALRNLGRYEDAIASFDKALEFKPDDDTAWYNKACSYGLQRNIEQALKNLQQAINLNPDKYREMAKTDSDFDSIRDDEQFQLLIEGGSIPFLHVRSEGNEVVRGNRKISH
jgi:tetratricopeptide (TPR) repeat protein